MARAFKEPPADLPPVTDAHLRAAFEAFHWVGARYACAMEVPFLRQLVETRAACLRTAEWESTTRRTVVPVRRVRLGVDGHPVGWCTQMVNGPRAAITQPDLLENF